MAGVRRQRFIRVAGPRVQKVLDGLESLSKCSHKANYDYDSEDVRKMMAVIRNQVKDLERAFNGGANSADKKFSFDKNEK